MPFLQQGFRVILPLLLFLLIVEEALSPPVTQKKKDAKDNSVDETGDEDAVSSDFCNSLPCIITECLLVLIILVHKEWLVLYYQHCHRTQPQLELFLSQFSCVVNQLG
jgi:hypothetical protein